MKRFAAAALFVGGILIAGSCDPSPATEAPSLVIDPSGATIAIQPRAPTPGWDIVTPTACKDYTALVYDGNGVQVSNPVVQWGVSAKVAYFTNNGSSLWTGTGAAHVCGRPQGTNQGYGFAALSARWNSTPVTETLPIENGQTTSGYAPVTLTVTPASANLAEGEMLQLSAQGTDQFNTTRTELPVWASSNYSAEVSSSGLVTAELYGYGPVTITANENATTKDVPITVLGATSMTVEPPTISICQSSSTTVLARVFDQNGSQWGRGVVGWESGNTNIATVARPPGPQIEEQRQEVVTGIGVGVTSVTAGTNPWWGGFISYTASVKVNLCPPSASVSGPYSVNLYATARFTASGSSGVPPYTYEFQRQDCPQFGPCLPWQNWVAGGTTNYWDTVVYGCGMYSINVAARVTDSRGVASGASAPWRTAVNNPC